MSEVNCPECGADEVHWNAPRAFDARNAIIEECAKVAESFIGTLIITGPQDIAAAIRALKDKKENS